MPIWILVFSALLLRVILAAYSIGFDHPHEIYRTLEPIAALQGYSVQLPYEWKDGMLSQMPIFFQYHLLQWVAAIGVHSASGQALALRMAYSILSLFPMLSVWKMTRSRLACSILGFWPELIYRSVRLMDYSLEMGLFGLAIWLAIPAESQTQVSSSAMSTDLIMKRIAAGVVLGCLFFIRFHSVLYFGALACVIALGPLQRSDPREKLKALLPPICTFTLAYLISVIALGAWEAHLTHTSFFSPFLNYMRFNTLQNGAVKGWGAQPWHRYLSEIIKFYGWTAPAFALVWVLTQVAHRRRIGDLCFLALLMIPLLPYFFITHKEARFIFGFLWLLVPWVISTFPREGLPEGPWRRLGILCLILGFGINSVRVASRVRESREIVQDFLKLGPVLSRLQSETNSVQQPLFVSTLSRASPGSFFLRYSRGPLCYEDSPQCTGLSRTAQSVQITQNPEGHWVLVNIR